MLDTGPFLLAFTEEKGGDKVRKLIERREAGEVQIFIHPNNLAEAYKVISLIQKERPSLVKRTIKPADVVRSAYASLSVIQNEKTTIKLGALRLKYRGVPWGDLSSAALAFSLSEDDNKVPVVIPEHDRHFAGIDEVTSLRVSQL